VNNICETNWQREAICSKLREQLKEDARIEIFYNRLPEQESVRIRRNNIRAKQENEPATLTFDEWKGILEQFNFRCAYCQGDFEVLDHFVPLGQGVGTTKQNCLPACKSCDCQKRGLHPLIDD